MFCLLPPTCTPLPPSLPPSLAFSASIYYWFGCIESHILFYKLSGNWENNLTVSALETINEMIGHSTQACFHFRAEKVHSLYLIILCVRYQDTIPIVIQLLPVVIERLRLATLASTQYILLSATLS
jgi:hypothetical protein